MAKTIRNGAYFFNRRRCRFFVAKYPIQF